MIKEIACDIKDLVLSTGYFNTYHEYCEMIPGDKKIHPALYNGNGDYSDVLNNDVNGNGYLRKSGKVTISNATGNSAIKPTSCNSGIGFVVISYPLRIVLCVPKSKLEDDAFSSDLLCQEIISLLQSPGTFNIDGVRKIRYVIKSFDTDSSSVWKTEVPGNKKQINKNMAFVSIDLNANITVNTDCLTRICYGY